MCVRERDRERKSVCVRERDRERKSVCVRERHREREMSVCARVCVCVRVCVFPIDRIQAIIAFLDFFGKGSVCIGPFG